MKNLLFYIKLLISEFHGIVKIPLYHCMKLLPIQKRLIVFECGRGLSYSCNPKYIYEGMLQRVENYKFVWSLQDISIEIPMNPIKVKRYSLRYYYYLARARFWVHNGEFGLKIRRRKGTTYINTQHGTPLKKMGIDIPYFKDKNGTFEKTSKWDYLISPNSYSTNIFRKAYRYAGPILEIGYPRNDIFYQSNNPETVRLIKMKHKIPLDKKILLYAPTWRDSKPVGNEVPDGCFHDLGLDLQLLAKRLPEDYFLILRLHHLTALNLNLSELDEFLLDCSGPKYDIQELCLTADALITDYSSVMFDFANLKRPMVFYAYDLNAYRDQIRGFYLDLTEVAPGPIVFNIDQLIKILHDFDQLIVNYSKEVINFYNQFCYLDNGKATDFIINKFFNKSKAI